MGNHSQVSHCMVIQRISQLCGNLRLVQDSNFCDSLAVRDVRIADCRCGSSTTDERPRSSSQAGKMQCFSAFANDQPKRQCRSLEDKLVVIGGSTVRKLGLRRPQLYLLVPVFVAYQVSEVSRSSSLTSRVSRMKTRASIAAAP